jgi:hypothetical protein
MVTPSLCIEAMETTVVDVPKSIPTYVLPLARVLMRAGKSCLIDKVFSLAIFEDFKAILYRYF